MSAGLERRLWAVAAEVEAELDALLPQPRGPAARLAEAMRYAALGGGKRLRAALVAFAGEMLGLAAPARLRVAAAVELIHAYSLVHDDLPAMDDARLRRGRATVHRAFDEATAVLAGDALQTLAFEVLARDDWPAAAERRVLLVRELARAAGAAGMCGGQMWDLLAEGAALAEEDILALERLKTGALIGFCTTSAALLAGAGEEAKRALGAFGEAFGLLYQLTDDLLDRTQDAAKLGKDAGRDAERAKATLPALLGIEQTRRRARALRLAAEEALSPFGESALWLRRLAAYVETRSA